MLDSEQIEYIQDNFKIPVDSSNPATYWIISLDYESKMPTDEELVQLKSFCEYIVKRMYTPIYQRRLLEEKPFPADSMHNTTIFRKGSPSNPETWFFRRLTWEGGYYVPKWGTDEYEKFYSLVDIMARCESMAGKLSEKWQVWEKEHPEIFPVPVST